MTTKPPPASILPVLGKLKSVYILWHSYHNILAKIHRYSLGERIDCLFVEIIEAISIATFLSKEEKLPWVRLARRKVDTIKILLMVLWETKSFDNKKYIVLSEKIEEVGKMLGGWQGQLTAQLAKQNSPG
ncbi:MAG: four helix bundle protein [Patescibacteria group bacterium]